MEHIIGFIGAGNMGGAMIRGLLSCKKYKKEQLIAADLNTVGLKALKDNFGIFTTSDNKEVARKSDIIFLCVKPDLYQTVINQIKEEIRDNTIIVSIAAGKTISQVEEMFQKEIKLVRAMPNTPALVLEGMSALSKNEMVSVEEMNQIAELFQSFGKSEIVPESMMEAVTGVSGSSPAYTYLFIEAMADAAVLGGMPRELAYRFAAQAVLGAAKMVLESNMHPGQLKDMVCSPKGTTIEAVRVLEKNAFRGTVIDAVIRCMDKAKEMNQK